MATANELLISGESAENKVLIIDGDLRTIAIPADFGVFGVESDDDVLRVYFRGPRFYHDVDLSTFAARVHIENAEGDRDLYEVDDIVAEDNAITFTWLVGRFALKSKGKVRFSLCFKELDDDGNVLKEFNTTPATGTVLEGLESDRGIEVEYPDIIENILRRLDNESPQMVVSITEDDDGNYTSSRSVAEITEWINNGGSVELMHGKHAFQFDHAAGSYARFRRNWPMPKFVRAYLVQLTDSSKGTSVQYGYTDYTYGASGVDVTAEVGQTILVEEVDDSGKPTKWKAVDYQPRTHYKGIMELFNATLTGLSESEVLLEGFSMQAGETYYVTWNGVEYTCVCVEVPDTGGICLIGNASVLGLEDTGEPFVIAHGTEDGVNYFTMACSADGTDKAAVIIKGTGYIPIPAPYLTNALPYYIDAVVTGVTNGIDQYATSITTAEVNALLASGREIKMRLPYNEGGLVFILTMHFRANIENGYALGFFSSGLYSGMSNIVKILMPQADGTYTIEDSIGD